MAPPILLVEDDLSLAQALIAALEPAGIPVEHCPTGELAIELVQAKRYPLIVVELAFSVSEGVSGGYIVKALRKLPRHERPAVIMLASGSASLRGVDRSSITAMLFKPLDFALFTEYVTATYRRSMGPVPEPVVRGEVRRTSSYCGACSSPIPAWVPGEAHAFEAWADAPCAGCGMTPRLAGGRSDWIAAR